MHIRGDLEVGADLRPIKNLQTAFVVEGPVGSVSLPCADPDPVMGKAKRSFDQKPNRRAAVKIPECRIGAGIA